MARQGYTVADGRSRDSIVPDGPHRFSVVVLDHYDVLTTKDQWAVEDERDALEAFHAP